jgi:hypothetical protein
LRQLIGKIRIVSVRIHGLRVDEEHARGSWVNPKPDLPALLRPCISPDLFLSLRPHVECSAHCTRNLAGRESDGNGAHLAEALLRGGSRAAVEGRGEKTRPELISDLRILASEFPGPRPRGRRTVGQTSSRGRGSSRATLYVDQAP